MKKSGDSKTVKCSSGLSRREFMGAAAAVGAFTVVPRYVLARSGQSSPSEKLNIAGIGFGGRGAGDLAEVGSENIVALCDVDEKYAAGVFKQYPKAKKYRDFRVMLDKEGRNIDAVVIATPGPQPRGYRDDGHQDGKACLL